MGIAEGVFIFYLLIALSSALKALFLKYLFMIFSNRGSKYIPSMMEKDAFKTANLIFGLQI